MTDALLIVGLALAFLVAQYLDRRSWQRERRELLVAVLSKSAPDALILSRALGGEPTAPTEPEPQRIKPPSLPLGL